MRSTEQRINIIIGQLDGVKKMLQQKGKTAFSKAQHPEDVVRSPVFEQESNKSVAMHDRLDEEFERF